MSASAVVTEHRTSRVLHEQECWSFGLAAWAAAGAAALAWSVVRHFTHGWRW